MKKKITISDMSDPEQAARYGILKGGEYSYLGQLVSQIKLNLLLSEKMYMPLGFLIDNPALWHLINNDPSFKELFIPNTHNSEYSALSIGVSFQKNHPVEKLSFKESFNLWRVGENQDRVLFPSSLRTAGVSPLMKHEEFPGWNDSKRTEQLDLKEYAERLGLKYLLSAADSIESIYNFSEKCKNPKNRHQILLGKIVNGENFMRNTFLANEIEAWDRLKQHIKKNKLSKISRSEINQYLGDKAWNRIAPQINTWRIEGYIENLSDLYTPVSMTSNIVSAKYNSNLIDAIKSYSEVNTKNTLGWQLIVDRLTFEDIIKIRRKVEFREILLEISNFDNITTEVDQKFTLSDYSRFVRDTWAPCLVDILSDINPDAIEYSSKQKKDDDKQKSWAEYLCKGSLAGTAATYAGAAKLYFAPALPFSLGAMGVGSVALIIYNEQHVS